MVYTHSASAPNKQLFAREIEQLIGAASKNNCPDRFGSIVRADYSAAHARQLRSASRGFRVRWADLRGDAKKN